MALVRLRQCVVFQDAVLEPIRLALRVDDHNAEQPVHLNLAMYQCRLDVICVVSQYDAVVVQLNDAYELKPFMSQKIHTLKTAKIA